MELSYRQLEACLQDFLSVHPDSVPTLRARIKQLQRMGFPEGVNSGRGIKVTYSGEQVFQLATAFELISSGLSAEQAKKVVMGFWHKLKVGYALSSQYHLSQIKIFAVLVQDHLGSIKRNLDQKTESPFGLGISDIFGINEMLESHHLKRPLAFSATLLLDLTTIFRRVMHSATNAGKVGRRLSDDPEIVSWRDEAISVNKKGWLTVQDFSHLIDPRKRIQKEEEPIPEPK